MEEETAAAFQREGEITFSTESTADDTAADSQSEGENKDKGTHSSDGDNSQSDDKTPFHDHPRWKQREEEWNSRFNQQETRHQNDLKEIREEFGQQRKDNAASTKIPTWFGGTQEQWDAYRSDRDADIKAAEDRAVARTKSEFANSSKEQTDAVKEATDYMNTEVSALEADKTLNPTGAKIDREKLLKTVVENELIDTKGRWNYRAGMRIMNGAPAAPAPKPKPSTNEKKDVAAATTSERGGETKAPTYATSDTFKKDRPW